MFVWLRWGANVIYNVICLLFNLLFISCVCVCGPVEVLFVLAFSLVSFLRVYSHPLLFWLICLSRSMKSIRSTQNWIIVCDFEAVSIWQCFVCNGNSINGQWWWEQERGKERGGKSQQKSYDSIAFISIHFIQRDHYSISYLFGFIKKKPPTTTYLYRFT